MSTFSSITTIFSNIASAINAKGVSGSMTPFEMASKITAIPSGGITPSGNIQLTKPTSTDVTNYATATVKTGSVTTPATLVEIQSTIAVNSSGLITASNSKTESITPSVTDSGWISEGTAGTVTMGGSSTLQMSTQEAKTITPSLSQQTAVAAGKYTTGNVVVEAMSVGSVSVSDDTITKNPSIVLNNSTGLITASYSSSKTISPNVTEGWVSSGTSGTIRTSGTNNLQLLTQEAKTITPTDSQQVAVESERYTTGQVVVEAVPDEMKSISTNDIHTPTEGKWFSYVDVYVPDFDLMAARSIVNASGRSSVIGSYAFVHCTLLETCDFPNVTSISTSAFSTCTKLTTISFPACQNIGTYAFRGCTELTELSFPACKVIQSNAFSGCTGVTVARFSALSQIQSYAFRGCTKLSQIYLLGSSVCALVNSNAFSSTSITSTKGTIFVPSSLYTSYRTATNWTRFSARMSSVTV